MLKTITTISFLLAVFCITYCATCQEFYQSNYILYFGLGNALIFLLIMAIQSIQTTRELRSKARNENTNN